MVKHNRTNKRINNRPKPSNAEAAAPVTTEANAPATAEAEAPVTSEVNVPASVPATVEANAPSATADADAEAQLDAAAKAEALEIFKKMQRGTDGRRKRWTVLIFLYSFLEKQEHEARVQKHLKDLFKANETTVASTVAPATAPTVARKVAAPTVAKVVAPAVAIKAAAPTYAKVTQAAAPTIAPVIAPTVAPAAAPTVDNVVIGELLLLWFFFKLSNFLLFFRPNKLSASLVWTGLTVTLVTVTRDEEAVAFTGEAAVPTTVEGDNTTTDTIPEATSTVDIITMVRIEVAGESRHEW
jgi:hypothetical protein